MTRPARLLVLAAAALTLALMAGSMGWPLVHDAPLMHYIAWRIAEGAVPYRDTFDMNLPGVYLIHLALLKTLGAGDTAWRIFDLAWLAACAAGLVAFGRKLGDRWSAAGAALLFCLYHLAGGASDMGQRDFMLVPFLLASAWAAACHAEKPDRRMLVVAGLALGVALTLKPFAALWLGAIGLVVIRRRGLKRALAADLGVLGLSVALPLGLVFGWLWLAGGLGPFVQIMRGYVGPFYGSLGKQPLAVLLPSLLAPYAGPLGRWLVRAGLPAAGAWPVVLVAAGLGTWLLTQRLRERPGVPAGLLVAGWGYGLLHFVLQGKGWEYHAYPLVAFLCLGAGLLLAPAPGASSSRRLGAAGAAAFAVALTVVGAKAVYNPGQSLVAAKVARVEALAARLQAIVPPGGRVQVMDTTGGGLHALLKLHVAQPTRFIYDFHFYHDASTPAIQALRAEYVRDLRRDEPAALVIFHDSWLRQGYNQLTEFPALDRLIRSDYTLRYEEPGAYRLYAKHTHP